MDEELEVEAVDVSACVAVARRISHHPLQRLPEDQISPFDGIDERVTLEEAPLRRVANDRVALQPGYDQRRLGLLEQELQEASEAILGVLQLGPAEESRVAGDVRYREIPVLGEALGHSGTLETDD